MNALDLLVDFTTLISTSVEPMLNQDENSNAYIGPSYNPDTSSLTPEHPSPFEKYHSTQQMLKETVPCNFTANPPFRHILSRSASYAYDCETTNNEYQGVLPSYTEDHVHRSQLFNAYLQDNPNVGPPSKFTSVTLQLWPQQPEVSPQRTACYNINSSLTSVPNPWYDTQTPHSFQPPQHHTAPYQQVHNDISSQCWTQSPQRHYPAEDTWATWVTTEAPLDRDFLLEYNEGMLPGDARTQLNTG